MLVSSIVIGIIFGFLAALAAFVITYNEYGKHKFTGKRIFTHFRLQFSPSLFSCFYRFS